MNADRSTAISVDTSLPTDATDRRSGPAPADGGGRSAAEFGLMLCSTLELAPLLDRFSSALAAEVPFDGFAYRHEARSLGVDAGQTAVNSCSYQLRIQGEDLGEFKFYRRRRFREQDLALVEARLASLLLPLRNALRYGDAAAASTQDYLTGVLNRRALDLGLGRELARARRQRIPLALLMLDVDHFKAINTACGHPQGDRVLIRIAHCILELIRSSDQLFRYGGEEFVVLASDTDGAGARILAERIRTSVAELRFDQSGKNFGITVSIGVANLTPRDDPDILLRRADCALRTAKRGGRNQVVEAAVPE